MFVSDCLRVSREEGKPSTFFFFVLFFKSMCSGTLNMRAARKKIPVFVSKFGEIVFNFLFCLFFFFLLSLF